MGRSSALESLYKLRIRESAQLKTVLELYDMEIRQKISMPNYQKLKTMVQRRKDQKLRLRNFDARHGRIETGAVIKNRKGMSGVEGGKGTIYQWKEKGQCSKGDQCSAVSGKRAMIVPKNQTTMPPHLPSHPSHEVEVCRRKEVSKAKVTIVPFSDNRADIMWKVLARERLVNIGLLPSVNSTKQKRAAKPRISVCFRIMRLMNSQTKSQRKATIPTKEEKTTTGMRWLLRKLYHLSDALVSQ